MAKSRVQTCNSKVKATEELAKWRKAKNLKTGKRIGRYTMEKRPGTRNTYDIYWIRSIRPF